MEWRHCIRNLFLFAATNPKAYLERKEYLFVVSHMRSNSSLLTHILGSHSQISGYAEQSLSYRSKIDLLKLRCKIYHGNDRRLSGRYLLDKVLHNRFRLSDDLILRLPRKTVFLLRKPEPTLKSILHMGMNLVRREDYSDPVKVADYYCDRLAEMERCVQRFAARSGFLLAEELIDSPATILDGLTSWLELEDPLVGEYSIFKDTGKPGFGDPSEKIKSGRIVKGGSEYGQIRLPPSALDRAAAAYERCFSTLQRHSLRIIDSR